MKHYFLILALLQASALYAQTAQVIQALTSNTTGTNNSAQVIQALTSNTTGIYNSALGYQALYSKPSVYALREYELSYDHTGIRYTDRGGKAMNWFTTEHILALTLPASLIVAVYIITVRWNQIVAFAKSKNLTAHTIAALCIAAATLITTDPQVQQILVSLFREHPAALADITLLAGLIFKYTRSSSDAGVLATARDIHASGNAPTAAEVDAASGK